MTPAPPSPPAHTAPPPAPAAPRPGLGAGGIAPNRGLLLLSGEHFAAATAFLLAGAIGLVWVAPDLATGNYLSPHVAGVTHLFTLGWFTLTSFGALSQLLPVALGAPIYSPRLGHAAWWSLVPGIALFAWGVAVSSTPVLGVGVTLVAVGILLAVENLAATLRRGRTHDATWAAIAIGIGYLTTTLIFGLVLAQNLHNGFMAADRIRILTAHLHIAIVGWALIVIVGVSNRLLPMFLLAHGADVRWTRRALALLAPGVAALVVGLTAQWHAVAWLGTVLLDAGVGVFIWQSYAFYRVRVRRKLDVGMRFARASIPFFAASAVIGTILLARGGGHTRLATAYLIAGFLGGLVLFVTWFLYKIIPLLAWTARFGGRIGRGPVPMAGDLLSARVAEAQLYVTITGVVVVLAGIAAASPVAARVGTLLFLCGILLFVSQIVRIRWVTPAAFRSPPSTP